MFNCFHFLSSLYVGSLDIFLEILFALSVIFGMLVINSQNPIISVLFLIALFVSISINLILLGYNFIGLSYLLVYVGAISILFLFILMLINIRISELTNDTSNNSPLAIITSFYFVFILYIHNIVYLYGDNYYNPFYFVYRNLENLGIITSSRLDDNITTSILDDLFYSEIHYVTSSSWDNILVDFTDITSVGNVLYSIYGIWLILCSIILLLAMIGAISITKKEKD